MGAQTQTKVVTVNTTSIPESDEKGEDEAPFVLSEGLPAVPAKLVRKIQKGGYVDMAELLRDNMELCRRGEEEKGNSSKSTRRSVPDLLSWVACFGLYASIVGDKNPHRVNELWAYQTLLVREARRCGGRGWQVYDSMFRQQAANNPRVAWSQLNSSLYATSFLAHQNQRGRTCQYCLETDHVSQSCALAPPEKERGRSQGEPRWRSSERRRRDPANTFKMACFDWNDGRCSSPYCRFKHICASCGASGHTDLKCSGAKSLVTPEKDPSRE